jgi:integrase
MTHASRRGVATVTDAVGLDRTVGPQTFRKTWVTLVVLEGIERLTLRSVVGHRDEEMTEHYASIGDRHKRQAVEVLPDVDAGGDID